MTAAIGKSKSRRSSIDESIGNVARCLWLAAMFLLIGSSAFAQRDLGTITGTVTDSSGGAVAGATITITEI